MQKLMVNYPVLTTDHHNVAKTQTIFGPNLSIERQNCPTDGYGLWQLAKEAAPDSGRT